MCRRYEDNSSQDGKKENEPNLIHDSSWWQYGEVLMAALELSWIIHCDMPGL
jgi:hypothetical protein